MKLSLNETSENWEHRNKHGHPDLGKGSKTFHSPSLTEFVRKLHWKVAGAKISKGNTQEGQSKKFFSVIRDHTKLSDIIKEEQK